MELVTKITDQLFIIKKEGKANHLCSRCGKVILGNLIRIRPTHLRVCRQGWKEYKYHANCLETNRFILRINYIGFYILYLLEQAERKIILGKFVAKKFRLLRDYYRKFRDQF